jgi:two-component system, LuxR family, response regulator FixJ
MPRIAKTIAIIDDDKSVRHALRRLVQSAGWRALTFATAEAFLQVPAQLPAACIILDLCLPGLSGLELRKQLNAAGRMLPFIFITAHANERIREQALQAGAIAFLSKPFNDQDLLDVLDLAIS